MTAEAAAHVNAPVPSIAEICEELPNELDPVFRRAMAKDPAERYPTAAEFVTEVRAALAEAAGTTRSLPPVAAPVPRAPAPTPPIHIPPRPLGPPVSRRRPARRWAGLLGLLALGAIGGAIAAIVVTSGSDNSSAPPARERTVVRTVTRQGSTVQTTVTTPATSSAVGTTTPSSLGGSALNDAGYAKMQAGDYQGALPLLQSAVQKLNGVGYPTEAYANYNLGYTLLQLGRCDEAIPYLKKARKLEPERSEPGQALARAKACK